MRSNRIVKTAAVCAVLSGAACGLDMPQNGDANTEIARQTLEILNDTAMQELRNAPELASRLGISVSAAGYDYTIELDDRSQSAFERMRLKRLETLERLQRLPDSRLPDQLADDKAIIVEAYEKTVDLERFGHGQASLTYARPFVADQLSGAYVDLQNLLLFRQTISDLSGAQAYLTRLSLAADSINDDRRRLLADASAGIVPPDFILDRMVAQATALAAEPIDEQHALVATFERRLAAAPELSEDDRRRLVNDANEVMAEDVLPAYQAFIEALEDLADLAPSQPGIWQIPDGDAYYRAVVELYAGKPLVIDDLHRQGISIVSNLEVQLNDALSAAGFADGSVGERLSALATVDGQIYSDDEEGRAALLARMLALYDAANSRLSEIAPEGGEPSAIIAPVPDALSAAMPAAYYTSAPANNTSPAIFHVNLEDMTNWPDFSLPALVFHETVPGHHLESTYPYNSNRLSLMRQMIWPVAYGEGWALYAEDLAYELGLYADIPLAEIGYLQSLLFRAARLVADTGIHHQRWSRQDAIDYLVSTTGQTPAAMEAEVDRYTVWPGQAVAYMVGRNEILRLRNRAEEVLGSRFDLPEFHHAILAGGPRPFAFVEKDVDAWIDEELSP